MPASAVKTTCDDRRWRREREHRATQFRPLAIDGAVYFLRASLDDGGIELSHRRRRIAARQHAGPWSQGRYADRDEFARTVLAGLQRRRWRDIYAQAPVRRRPPARVVGATRDGRGLKMWQTFVLLSDVTAGCRARSRRLLCARPQRCSSAMTTVARVRAARRARPSSRRCAPSSTAARADARGGAPVARRAQPQQSADRAAGRARRAAGRERGADDDSIAPADAPESDDDEGRRQLAVAAAAPAAAGPKAAWRRQQTTTTTCLAWLRRFIIYFSRYHRRSQSHAHPASAR